MTGTPRARSRVATVLFPEAIPPVRPNRCTPEVYRRTHRRGRQDHGAVLGNGLVSARLLVPGTTSRRSALKTFVLGAVLASAGGTLAFVRTRGYHVERKTPLVALAPWELTVVLHAARRIAAPDRPDDRSIPSVDDVDVAGFVDGYVARMAPPLRRDLSRALLYLEQLAPLSVGKGSRFTELLPEDQDRVLEALATSPIILLRGAFVAIKSLVFMGYYRDARTWSIVGYDGPLVGRSKP